ncbi:MAG: hypothetical protein JWS10_1716 [Cypionkella sp.]|uniref:hypothetical protein n=1 Tax=Cypionkella sp. TaxID=2811411 RepID=UPI00261B8995|nr:hypothetical protein [Cypionkella sp.]MDB5659101.1 hypothetical protein [Cypionkella sp.]
MTALQLTRVEQSRLYTAMCAALGVPDQIETQRLAAFEARAHAFSYECLEAYILADTLDTHIHSTGAEHYSINAADVEEQAECTTAIAKNALGFLGLFRSPARGRLYTNDPTLFSPVLALPQDLFTDWRSLDW